MKRFYTVFFCVLLLMGMLAFATACSDDGAGGGSGASGEFMDPYEAYGLQRGEGGLGKALYDNPPKAIRFQVLLLHAFRPEGITLDIDEISLEKGESTTISFEETILLSQDNVSSSTGYIKADIDILFDPPKKDEGLMFTVFNKGEHQTAYDHVGYSEPKVTSGSFDGETQYQIGDPGVQGLDGGSYLVFFLGEKGKAGNSGELICEITGVKR